MINFRVIAEANFEQMAKVVRDLYERGFDVVDVLSADILRDEDNTKVGECFAVCCRGSAWNYLQLRKELTKKHGLREIKWEGIRTLA